jgi:hypothetical protein
LIWGFYSEKTQICRVTSLKAHLYPFMLAETGCKETLKNGYKSDKAHNFDGFLKYHSFAAKTDAQHVFFGGL